MKATTLPTRVRVVERVHSRLRTMIVNGKYPPGAVLSQVQLANMLGVSRTPLREAMRRLEAEGLIHAEQNRRARVASADAEALDVLFTDRILLEAMGIKVTVPLLSEIELNGLLASAAALRIALDKGNAGAADRARRTFHRQLVARAGRRLRETIAEQYDRCERDRRLHAPLSSDAGDAYATISGACVARAPFEAVRYVARLEYDLARRVLASLEPDYTPVAIGVALQMLDRA
jgi:DNA-binding GntR family transcriptional regulator